MSPPVGHHIVFDASDLAQYFQAARLPTGIQRVQMQIIANLIRTLPDDFSVKIAAFSKATDFWAELSPAFFEHLGKLALASGDRDAPDWLRAISELSAIIEHAPPMAFPHGAFLINLGTSWWLQNYFLNVRMAKARYGIRYVPFVHDCIPIITPEHCVVNLTRDFISWVIGAFQHSDHVMVNSQSTANDLRRVASYLGHEIPDPAIVRLDARYGDNERAASAGAGEVLFANDLRPGGYVLFVGTIESRKNHLLAFSAWLALLKKYGSPRIPKLVCVGNRGWLNDAIYAKLAASVLLEQQVVMLSGVPDPDLEQLYRNCLFTLFPSSYEGWGLPVTESLSLGKVPLVSNCSSLPEAGAEFAEYFDLGSEAALVQKLERLMFDDAYRQTREAKIRAVFRPRSWAEIGGEILDLVRGWAGEEGAADRALLARANHGLWPFQAEPGRYHGITENRETRIWPGMSSGEMFRQGSGWWWPEPWGTWIKPPSARLAFRVALSRDSAALVYIGLRGVQGSPSTATVKLAGVGSRQVPLEPNGDGWVVFRVAPDRLEALRDGSEDPLFDLSFAADKVADFRETTGGVDPRIASLGVRGFMVCEENDVLSRLRFLEGAALRDLGSLENRPSEVAPFA